MKPAILFRAPAALLLALAFFRGAPARAIDRLPAPEGYAQLGRPDQAEGAKILAAFRAQGLTGDYYLAFELRVLPRRGDERDYRGQLWGGRDPLGPVSRLSILTGAAGTTAETRLLVQNGPRPAVWRWESARPGDTAILGADALFTPIGGTGLTAFDLQMPYLFWQGFTYEGLTRVRDRPAYTFVMRPPPALAAQNPALAGVRIWLDAQFDALVQAAYLGADGRPLKTVTVLDLKKIGDQWIVKSIDIRDDATRDKTRFVVTAAALNLDFLPNLFAPASLATALQPPEPDKIAVFDTP